MKITLAEWNKLEKAFKDARTALNDALQAVLDVSDKYPAQTHMDEYKLFSSLADYLIGAHHSLSGVPSMLHPQSEWTGGASDDPKNHKLREPHIVGLNRRYFTPEEVAEAQVECLGPYQWETKEKEQGEDEAPFEHPSWTLPTSSMLHVRPS